VVNYPPANLRAICGKIKGRALIHLHGAELNAGSSERCHLTSVDIA